MPDIEFPTIKSVTTPTRLMNSTIIITFIRVFALERLVEMFRFLMHKILYKAIENPPKFKLDLIELENLHFILNLVWIFHTTMHEFVNLNVCFSLAMGW